MKININIVGAYCRNCRESEHVSEVPEVFTPSMVYEWGKHPPVGATMELIYAACPNCKPLLKGEEKS